MENRRSQCAGYGCELGVLGTEYRACTPQANIGPRILKERVGTLEALRQLLLLRDRRGETFHGSGFEPLCPSVRTQAVDPVVHRLLGRDEAVVIAEKAGPRLQYVAVEGRFGKREIVEGPQRHCIGRYIGVQAAQQQPSEQTEK